MKQMMARRASASVLLVGLVLSATPAGRAAAVPPSREAAPPPAGQDQQRAREAELQTSRDQDNGIDVGDPKVFDDAMLREMLQAAEAKLAALQLLDQQGVSSRIGAISGASQRISSFGLNVQGASLPGVTTTAKGPTATSVGTVNDTDADGTANNRTLQTTTTSGGVDRVTTSAQTNPPAVTAPAATTTLPSAFQTSASDMLNEQLQLTLEIANLRLLLEGALSDHIVKAGTEYRVKPRTTIGFPITIETKPRFKNAVAVVEAVVTLNQSKQISDGPDRPSITALLPREKTYNVAAITDSSSSVGGGVVTGVVGVSGSWLRGQRAHYLVQDQDTVALSFTPKTEGQVGVAWQFRPVLGRSYVRAGLKQTFVQLSFPTSGSADQFGTVSIRTYWLKYDQKNGTVGKLVGRSLAEREKPWPIARLPVNAKPAGFNANALQDLGGGQMLVTVQGQFVGGTYVRIGGTVLREGAVNATFENAGIRFVAPIADLATKNVALVSRDGSEQPLVIDFVSDTASTLPLQREVPVVLSSTVTAVDDANSLLTIEFAEKVDTRKPALVIVIGDRVFGYKDAPVLRSDRTMAVTVPTALLLANPTPTVKHLFGASERPAPVRGLNAFSRGERLVLLEQGNAQSTYLLHGYKLERIAVLEPAGVVVTHPGRPEDAGTLAEIRLTTAQLKGRKQLLLQRTAPDERPFLVTIPPGEARTPSAKARERVVVDADEAFFEIENLDDPVKVVWKAQILEAQRLDDKKTLRVFGLKAKGVTTHAAPQVFEFSSGAVKATGVLDIVNTRVETIPK
ncbi:MAG TPA: hypothetical protein VMZ66_09030 [Aeromicrobium sp.]|nr:hypothetical protein [Aeromicrobium sp.]